MAEAFKTRKVYKHLSEFGLLHNYGYTNEDDGLDYAVFIVNQSDYEDLGKPEQITVTVEAGDLLND